MDPEVALRSCLLKKEKLKGIKCNPDTRSMINNERQIFWTRRVRYFRAK